MNWFSVWDYFIALCALMIWVYFATEYHYPWWIGCLGGFTIGALVSQIMRPR